MLVMFNSYETGIGWIVAGNKWTTKPILGGFLYLCTFTYKRGWDFFQLDVPYRL